MKNIMVYHVIADNSDDIQLSVMEDDNGELNMAGISFKELTIKEIFWDNTLFIFNNLRASLLNYLNRSMSQEDKDNLEELTFLDEEYAQIILDILGEGIKRGWDKAK